MRTIPTKEQVLKAADQCPRTKEVLAILFPQDFEDPNRFPDDCTNYGVFVIGSNLYIREGLYNMGILSQKRYSEQEPVPPGYKCARYHIRDMSILPDLRSIPIWIRTHDYGEIT